MLEFMQEISAAITFPVALTVLGSLVTVILGIVKLVDMIHEHKGKSTHDWVNNPPIPVKKNAKEIEDLRVSLEEVRRGLARTDDKLIALDARVPEQISGLKEDMGEVKESLKKVTETLIEFLRRSQEGE